MHSMHPQKARSYSFCRFRETSPLQSLGAPNTPITLPGGVDARSSLQLPKHNLGRGSCRVGKSSIGSLQKMSSRAQKQAVSFPDLDRIAPAYNLRRSSSEPTLPQHFALEERTRQLLKNDPPPTQLSHVVAQLRAELCTLQHVVRQLAELQSVACSKKRDNIELGKNSAHNKTNNNNNDDDNNNNNDHNKNSQESGLNSLDLDDDNPESEQDLDRTSLVSFNSAMRVESSLGSSDQHEADLSLDNLGHQMMTIGSSLGSLDHQQQDEQEGKTTRMSFGKTKPKKRVTFSKATLAAYNEKMQNKENRCCKTTLACWSNFQQDHHKTQEAWQDGPSKMQQQTATASERETLSIGYASTTA